jgi:Uma2 family endonuclease
MAVHRQGLTLAEFLELPEEEPALEYIEGQVTRKVSPKLRHGRIQGKFVERVNQYGEPRKLAMAVPEVRTSFAGASSIPDVSVFTWERIPRDSSGELPDEVTIPPDIAGEIISPGQQFARLAQRCRWYVEHGALLSLLFDPQRRLVYRFRPGERESVLRGAEPIDLAPVLPQFELSVEELFSSLRP